jgi:ribosomal-protein-alanine acetyltransferase
MTSADLKPVVLLERKIFPDAWPESAFRDILEDNDWSAVVAEYKGKIIGYGIFMIVLDESHLANIAVDKPFRRKSVAKHLLEHILRVVQDRKCEIILLEVRISNRGARAFYERFGFKELYRRKKYYRDPVEDALVMSLSFN